MRTGAALLLVAAPLVAGCAGTGVRPAAVPPPAAEEAAAAGAFALAAGGAAERPVVRVPAGRRTAVELRVANAADRPRRFRLGAGGAAAAWARLPRAVTVLPRSSRPVRLELRVPGGVRPGRVSLAAWAEPAEPAAAGGVGVVYRSGVRITVVVRSVP